VELLRNVLEAWKLPDLRRRLLFTFAMLVLFRFIAHIPVPNIDTAALQQLFRSNEFLGMLDLFSGGAMRSLSVAAMGVYPYITASIIMQLLVPVIPRLEEMAKEGESGRRRINQMTHWLTVPLAALQAYGTGVLLSTQNPPIIRNFGLSGEYLLPTLAIVIAMTAGTMLLVWMGELITENGIGNGVSIIIFGGIVAALPQFVGQSLVTGDLVALVVLGVVGALLVAAIVVVQEAQRRIPVQYAKRVRGNRVYGGGSTHVPLRVNSAGMIPLIFAMSILLFPSTVASYFLNNPNEWLSGAARFVITYMSTTSVLYWGLYFLLVVAFTFFYTMVLFQQQNLAENLQKYGGFIPGIRPGRPTQEYLNRVLFRITWLGALFLGFVAVIPFFVRGAGNAILLSSTGLLIVVGVVLDTMKQLEAQLLMRRYEGFIK
jgi:preprotein translocase subunit SecY